jgi:DDE superfamily endonuclease
MSCLVGLGRKTVSGMLCASAQQFTDWSAPYRLFERERFDIDALFAPIRHAAVKRLQSGEPLVVIMDDTLIRKRGRKVHGAGWRRDPLGPPFCSNFVWGQRFLQISAALPDAAVIGRARGVPIDLVHAPSPPKPSKRASEQQWTEYREKQKVTKVSSVGAKRITELRARIDEQDNESRRLIVAVDGGFTNRAVLRNLPHDTVAIGRIRKDARLFLPPDQETGPRRGRRRWYGDPLPTPEKIRQDDSIPWLTVEAFAAGKTHSFEVKTIAPVRWRATGQQDVRLVVIRPLAYRPRKGSRLLYREPAYLLCTDPNLPLDRLLQSYLWRWKSSSTSEMKRQFSVWAKHRCVSPQRSKQFRHSLSRHMHYFFWRALETKRSYQFCRSQNGEAQPLRRGLQPHDLLAFFDRSYGGEQWG